MTDQADKGKELQELVSTIRDRLDADAILYAGTISSPSDHQFVRDCCSRQRRKNVLLILSTLGGSADSAYRIARCLQRSYACFSVYIDGMCKSAGTLLALGADEVIMSDFGELGPLDVQISKPDELFEISSGLTPMQALNTLRNQAFESFESHFLDLRLKSGLQITTRSAADIASNLTVGLFAPIFGQIDPMRLGEIDRAVKIAIEYGNRLGKRNLKPETLDRLVANYPAHEFVIDREEAADLFNKVRAPASDEEALALLLRPIMEESSTASGSAVYLDDLAQRLKGDGSDGKHGEGHTDSQKEQPGNLSHHPQDGSGPAEEISEHPEGARNPEEGRNPGG